MSEDTLPGGVWQVLFPRAVRLVGEIAEHGGVADPFFTFGGGTVLMLRYNHRLSKDIDFFVPDPQSLGYVTPRLSDVADEICNSQYTEAAGYVKLQMEEGEIDFVASPNLLPADTAYESWELFGKPVRVETAAEIVAKKMHYRGNVATPRDLFDLALVVDRAKDELVHAENFMFRHIDAFVTHVSAPSEQFLRQFDSIEALDYRPSFDEASTVALSYLAGLSRSRDISRHDAEAFVQQSGMTLGATNLEKGDYCGPIVQRTQRHLVQDVGKGEAIIHDSFRVPLKAQDHAVGTGPLRLRYEYQQAHIVAPSRVKGRDR
ncbi:hypothetical protein LMG19282_01504 [Cupriavidus campinensis]|uniref:Nucleotidyl transferase AbiEii/AbiGii toxin family protein n=1 Tax=Cupriavidus campinensis TaxID=151783 RepID=A0ABY3EJL4_9BURK|nr:nucleotidyl transferase AbiEii/AbiGii toxin family protein [Cupriavidus campinensis]TSP10968.1 nucleotidyl transferase AbiEii/AbiGii toxin family protein [Cupriavidus campinensis]CAG2138492.1 hypothetical protein LMG19282_01504 [Cupriavidus campinensis]